MSQELTPVQLYQSYVSKTNIESTIDITSLATLRERASKVVVNDITNEAEMAIAKEMRKELSDARIEISKTAKAARDEFTAINRGIREVELILLGEFEDEEERLKDYEKQLKAKNLRDERMLVLPKRKERLSAMGVAEDDEVLLAMDDLQFSNFLIDKQEEILVEKRKQEEIAAAIEAAKEEAANKAKEEAENKARLEAEAKEREHQAELARIQAEKDAEEEAARKAKEEAENKARLEAEAKEREHQAELARIQAEKDAEEEAARKAKEEAERLAKEKEYQAFLKDYGYNEEEFITKDEGDKVVLYKRVAVYVK